MKQHWASKVVENRGQEFPGETNPFAILGRFSEQSTAWKGLATDHLHLLVHVATIFTEQLLRHILGSDPATFDRIMANYVTLFFAQKEQVLRRKLEEILPSSSEYEIAMEDEIEHDTNTRYRTRLNNQISKLEVE